MSRREVAEQPPGDLRERVGQAAIDVIYTEGFSGATMRTIVEHAGVQMSSVYYYYDSKQQLLLSIMERTLRESTQFVAERIAAVDEDDVLGQLWAALEAHAEWHVARQREACIADAELGRLDPPLRERVVALRDEQEGLFRAIVERGVRLGQLQTADPALITRMLLTASTGVATWYRPGRSHDASMIARVLYATLVDGLRAA